MSVSSIISSLSFCLDDLAIDESGVQKSATIIRWCSRNELIFNNVSLTNVGVLAHGT